MVSKLFDPPLLRTPILAGLLCLAVVLCFHSPRWWLLTAEKPGTFEWTRAASYLKQCENPFRPDVEPAMRWRFMPQVIVWALGGERTLALAVPFAGAWALLAYLYHLALRHTRDPAASALLTLLLGSSAPALVSTGWLGMNDAWVALGLCYLGFGRYRAGLIVACLLCPFVDERFVFGIPGAVAIRNWDEHRGMDAKAWARTGVQCSLAAIPFLAGRVTGAALRRHVGNDVEFVLQSIQQSTSYLWFAPLGVWMALRFAWLPVLWKAGSVFAATPRGAVFLVGVTGLPVVVGFLLASDTMRTAGILLPVAVWSAIAYTRQEGRRRLAWLAAANLIFAAAHVTYTKLAPINSLPVELWRLIR